MITMLSKDAALEYLENQQRWEETITYCEQKWLRTPNCDSLLRLMSQAWFLCAYIEQLSPYNGNPLCVSFNYIRSTSLLCNTLKEGDSKYSDEIAYLCLTGHMMKTLPEFFVSEEMNYYDVRRSGLTRLKQTYDRNQMLGELFCDNRKHISFDEANQLFPGNSEVDLYFKSLFSME